NATTFLGAPNTTYPATIGGTSVTLGNPSAPVTLKLANTSGVAPAPIAVTVTATSHMSDIANIPFASVGLNYAGVDGRMTATLPIYFLGSNQGNVTLTWY